jgi:hypothetical protein
MFQFPGFASPAYEFSRRYRRSGGLPHSEIHGSMPARGSPWLIATCCVLHRLSVPRHPPDALQTLDLCAYPKGKSHHSHMRHAQEKARKGPAPPGRIRSRCITDPTARPAVASGSDLSGRPRSQILFTCQRSHTAPRGRYLRSLSRIFLRRGRHWSLKVILRHPAPLSWWRRTGSNRRPHACKARALPTELRPRNGTRGVVGQGRLELPTSRLSSARSNQLSY